MKRRSVASSLPTTYDNHNKASNWTKKPLKRQRADALHQVVLYLKKNTWLLLPVTVLIVGLVLWKQFFFKRTSNVFAIRRPPTYAAGSNHASLRCEKTLLSRRKLDKSLGLGVNYLFKHQKDAGDFDYEYDWKTGINSDETNEVRMAGSLWGLTLIFIDMMDHAEREGVLSGTGDGSTIAMKRSILQRTAARIQRSIDFFHTNSKVLVDGSSQSQMRYITYPGEDDHTQGTQALICLSLIDYLRALGSPSDALAIGVTMEQIDQVRTMLDEVLPFLVTQHASLHGNRFREWDNLVARGQQALSSGVWYGGSEQDEQNMVEWWLEGQEVRGSFSEYYDADTGVPSGDYSPYSDGESLLAMIKAAKYLGPRYTYLWPFAVGTARAFHQTHVVEAQEDSSDSDITKGAYQWLSMSFFHLATVTLGKGYAEKFDIPSALESTYNTDQFGKWLLDLAMWMIDVHDVLNKRKNTGYAYEGIVSAYAWVSHLVESGTDTASLQVKARKLECTIEEGLNKLIGWQVGMGAEENTDDDNFEWDGVSGLGGVQNAAHQSPLRIDVTVHQMHAIMLTRRIVYETGVEWPWDVIVV